MANNFHLESALSVHGKSIPKGCTEDHLSVSALPDDWVPVRSKSDTIERYLENRAAEHERVLRLLQEEADAVSNNIEEQLRLEARIILSHIEQYDKDADSAINADTVTDDNRMDVEIKLNDINEQRLTDINDFKKATQSLENKRIEELQKLLGVYFKKLVGIGHKPPYILLEEFQEKIFLANQQLTCNARTHAELRAQLATQAETARVKCTARLDQLLVAKRRGLIRSVSENSIHTYATPPAATLQRSNSMLPFMFSAQQNTQGPVTVDEETKLQTKLEKYKLAVKGMFTIMYIKIQALHETLAQPWIDPVIEANVAMDEKMPQFLRDLEKFRGWEMQFKDLIPTGSEASSMSVSFETEHIDTNSIDVVWREGVNTLADELEQRYKTLHILVSHCELDIESISNEQIVTVETLQQICANNDSFQSAMEMPLDTAISELALSADHEKLNKQYEVVQSLLKTMFETIEKHHDVEIDHLYKFRNLLDTSAINLNLQIGKFIEKFEEERGEDSVSRHEERCLPPDLLQGNPRLNSLFEKTHWLMTSLTENLKYYPGRVQKKFVLWLEHHINSVNWRLTQKMSWYTSYNKRAQSVLERRRDQLLYHERRLKRHAQAVLQLEHDSLEKVNKIINLKSKDVYPIEYWLEDVLTRMENNEPQELKLLSYQQRLSRMRRSFEESIEEAFVRCNAVIEQDFEKARSANEEFRTHLTCFADGGDFAPAEASRASAALDKANASIAEVEANVVTAAELRKTQCLTRVMEMMQNVEDIADEAMLEFRQPASGQGKKSQKK